MLPATELVNELLSGDRRKLARVISLIENEDPHKYEIISQLYPHTGKAYVVGITGAPGAGKSLLVDKLIGTARRDGLKVGVIAVDPTSPFSGGAILGDRIRMQGHSLDKDVFIRSMGTRGSLGGLSRATKDVVQVLDAFGKDIIIIETVGVGQSEVDIVKTADTILVILTPAGGDSVQTIKAGIMEIADIFVINKADLPDVNRTYMELNVMLEMASEKKDWRPPIVKTVSIKGEGIEELWSAIEEHRKYMEVSGKLEKIRRERVRQDIINLVENIVKSNVWKKISQKKDFDKIIDKMVNREIDPYSAAAILLKGTELEV